MSSWAERTGHLMSGDDHVLGISSGFGKRGNYSLGNAKFHFQALTCKAIIVQEIAQVSKCTSLCRICREVLWLGCSLILW